MLNKTVEDNIVIAEFDNGKFNTITLETLRKLGEIVKEVNETEELKGLILTGKGRVFCSGFDLGMFLDFKDLDAVIEFFKEEEEILMDLFMCKKPVIAAMNGASMAGGLITAMACDYRIIKNHPKIQVSMSEVKIGLGLSIVQTALMKYGLGGNRQYENIMYNGERYNVEQALEIGMVDELAEEDNLIPRAKELIVKWIDNPGRAFSLLKGTVRQPAVDEMKYYLKNSDWGQGLNCMFDPQTRATLEVVKNMMK